MQIAPFVAAIVVLLVVLVVVVFVIIAAIIVFVVVAVCVIVRDKKPVEKLVRTTTNQLSYETKACFDKTVTLCSRCRDRSHQPY